MAIKITDECINCGACETECPNNAIYEGASEWRVSDGTRLKGTITSSSGLSTDAKTPHPPKKDNTYFIVTDKCTECVGFHLEPKCASVCPVDCCLPDEKEDTEELFKKKVFLHT
ncbi:ferredoxin [Candidatus Uzinura diaspidicola str. ASNER]|uniref:Ferredoxin n=1 Tax=Candidatus Uzinura diaspidicola str. ASNER TaxID=1133592 RepID=L7VJE2_9FLAO|nr:ferredoxin [Candidatus Uzinura diaspidicola str. ASNER]